MILPCNSQMIFFLTAGRNGTAFSSGLWSPKEPATVGSRRTCRYRFMGASSEIAVNMAVSCVRVGLHHRASKPAAGHFSLPNSDGESNLVSKDVLVGEKSELPPAPRQTFWNL